jgi:hypothetical protein
VGASKECTTIVGPHLRVINSLVCVSSRAVCSWEAIRLSDTCCCRTAVSFLADARSNCPCSYFWAKPCFPSTCNPLYMSKTSTGSIIRFRVRVPSTLPEPWRAFDFPGASLGKPNQTAESVGFFSLDQVF